MKKTAAALLMFGTALPVVADYEVDEDLGILPIGDTPIVGTTAERTIDPGPPPVTVGGKNNSLFVKDLIVQGELQTWGNEYVYRFELATPSFVSITSNSIQGDADFFLLDGLTTTVDGGTGKVSADDGLDVALLDRSPPETWNYPPLAPGTYFLAVENYDGVDGDLTPGDTVFDVTLNVQEAEAIDLAIDLGPLTAAGSPLSLDTFGSSFDTELAVYDILGTLLAENNDAGGGEQSEVSLPDGLPADFYYAVIAGNDTVFGPDFALSSGGAVGDWVFNYPLGPVLDPGVLTGTTNELEHQWVLFSVAPLPVNPVDLGTLATEGEQFSVDTLGSDFDTQLSMFDSAGFWLAINDDIDFDNNILESELFFEDGLQAGTYYFAVAGWPHLYADGFFVVVETDTSPVSEGGAYVLNYPGGMSEGSVPSNEHLWFSFDISALPNIDITGIDFDPDTNEFTVSWDSPLGGPFTVWAGNGSDFAALQAPPDDILPINAASEVTSPATFTLPAELQGEPQVFLQVTN